jgi:hypothetical protein
MEKAGAVGIVLTIPRKRRKPKSGFLKRLFLPPSLFLPTIKAIYSKFVRHSLTQHRNAKIRTAVQHSYFDV